jgi:C1A family cysteine protease
MNQGALGSCTAHGIIGAMRYNAIYNGKHDFELSRLQLYYDERVIEGAPCEDTGAEIRDGIKCAAKIGVGREYFWPYKIGRFMEKPIVQCYNNAKEHKALTYARVNVSARAIKEALAMDDVVVIGISIYRSFENSSVSKSGIVPMPKKTEAIIGGHCMYVVGYGQLKGYFTVRNSWATDWGNKGDCFIPEAYLGNPGMGSDYWVIRNTGK